MKSQRSTLELLSKMSAATHVWASVLTEADDQNVRTWKFADHSPTTFAVTYFYVNDGHGKRDPVTNCSAKMELPTKVTVSTNSLFRKVPEWDPT
jgi:hypothetical protein